MCPLRRKPQVLYLARCLHETNPFGLELNIQNGPEGSPELPFELNKVLASLIRVSELIQKLLGITRPSLIKQGRFHLPANRIRVMDSVVIQQMVARIRLVSSQIGTMGGDYP
jgi:hypothetical protein